MMMIIITIIVIMIIVKTLMALMKIDEFQYRNLRNDLLRNQSFEKYAFAMCS